MFGEGVFVICNEVGSVVLVCVLVDVFVVVGVWFDVVFVNVGVVKFVLFVDSDEVMWDFVFNINVKGVYF